MQRTTWRSPGPIGIVFIEGVPESWSEAQGNAARRFINLIDTLYDAQVRGW